MTLGQAAGAPRRNASHLLKANAVESLMDPDKAYSLSYKLVVKGDITGGGMISACGNTWESTAMG